MSKQSPQAEKEFPGQHEGEEVQFLFRQHPLVMRKALIGGLLAIMLGVLPLDFEQVYAVPLLAAWLTRIALTVPVIVLLAWVYRWIGWYYSINIVTNERILIIQQRGLFNRQVDEWQLDGITNVNYKIGGFQAVLFGYGDISAKTYVGDLELPTIHNPASIHDKLLTAVRKAGGGGSTQPPTMG